MGNDSPSVWFSQPMTEPHSSVGSSTGEGLSVELAGTVASPGGPYPQLRSIGEKWDVRTRQSDWPAP
jgi:hypothetical protein